MASNPVITQTPNPFTPDANPPNNKGQVTYTDLSYNIVPDISNNPTYTLRTNVADDVFDVFQNSTNQPQAFVPNSLFTATNLSRPTAMAQDSVGNIYVGNDAIIGTSLAGTISVYNLSGVYLRSINVNSGGSGGSAETWYRFRFFAFDESDNLYVSAEITISQPNGLGIAYIPAGASTNIYAKTIFPPPSPYANRCRGLAFYAGYLYIVISQTPPAYVIKYNVSNNKYLLLDLSTTLPDAITTAGRPQALIYNSFYTGVSTPLLYLVSGNSPDIGNNKIYGISNITGTETLTGGTGTATMTTFITFDDATRPAQLRLDNSGNFYVGVLLADFTGKIARVTSTGTISNLSYISLSSSGPLAYPVNGLVFDGSLNLFVADFINSRVIQTRPKTFVFGGPSATSSEANYGTPVTTYLYDISNNAVITSFGLNIVCFKKGTKILCENDVYIPIEDLKIDDLVKTYKQGYQKIIKIAHSRSCDYVQSAYNQMYTYSRESNPDLTEDLHLTGGHSLLLDTLTDEEANDMKKIHWPTKEEYMVEDKYKLLACFSRKLRMSTEQNAEIYHLTLEPPENAKPSHVYGIHANGILVESCSQAGMEQIVG
jgi:hypothetical protein